MSNPDTREAIQRDEICEKLLNFLEIIRRLRAPDGCPWDREQTHKSLKSYVIEEAYELTEAIDSGDPEKIKEELGDVLLQIALHSQIALEEGKFDFGDVLDRISKKMIYRHPHVFGDVTVSSAREVEANWYRLKKVEKRMDSALDGIPKALPALLRAHRVSERAAKAGFDWPEIHGIFEKIDEELEEVKAAYRKGSAPEVLEEVGDLLFTIVNLVRRFGGNAEEVMHQANQKFITRFSEMRKTLPSSAGAREMDDAWEAVKERERALKNHPEGSG